MEWIGFLFCMGVAVLLVVAGVFMGLFQLAMSNRLDGDTFAALLMLVLGAWLGHYGWVHAPFTVLMK